MVCKIKCAAITGIDTQPVIVETDVCNGLPSFDMVGLLASNIKESRERVRTAIKNSGFMIPPKRITINFSPANIRKTGTYFCRNQILLSVLPPSDKTSAESFCLFTTNRNISRKNTDLSIPPEIIMYVLCPTGK